MRKILLILIIFIILLFVCKFYQNTEKFTAGESTRTIVELSGGIKTMVKIQRGNNKKIVLLLHNSPFDLRIWDSLFLIMQKLAESGVETPTLIAYDQRGHGTAWEAVDKQFLDDNVTNYQWPLDTFVQDCKKVIDTVIHPTDKIRLVGFGFGGVVSQKVALTFPDRIEKLILLQTSIRPINELLSEVQQSSIWISQNPNSSYVSPNDTMIQEMLCGWFYLPNGFNTVNGVVTCPANTGPTFNLDYKFDDAKSPQFILAETIFREGSVETLLQTDKLIINTNLEEAWANAKNINFTIHILAGTDDPFASPNRMAQTYTAIYNHNRSVTVVLDIVKGKHGFTITRADYIAGIICEKCKDAIAKVAGGAEGQFLKAPL
jgi:pimeloyl-ACP methyl ester carboxylesterase